MDLWKHLANRTASKDASPSQTGSDGDSSSNSSGYTDNASQEDCQPSIQLDVLKRKARTEKARAAALLSRQRKRLEKEKPLEEHPAARFKPDLQPQPEINKPGNFTGTIHRRRLRVVYSWFKAWCFNLIKFLEGLVSKGSASHCFTVSVVDDSNFVLSQVVDGAPNWRKARVVPVMNLIQSMVIGYENATSASATDGSAELNCEHRTFLIHTPLVCLAKTNAGTLGLQLHSWLLTFLGKTSSRFQCFGLGCTAFDQFPIQGTLVCFDSLVVNLSMLKTLRVMVKLKSASEQRVLHPLLATVCLLHQCQLVRKPLIYHFTGFWASITRLAHLFESSSFRQYFKTALISVVCRSFRVIHTTHLPDAAADWKQARNKLCGMVTYDPSYSNYRRLLHWRLCQFDSDYVEASRRSSKPQPRWSRARNGANSTPLWMCIILMFFSTIPMVSAEPVEQRESVAQSTPLWDLAWLATLGLAALMWDWVSSPSPTNSPLRAAQSKSKNHKKRKTKKQKTKWVEHNKTKHSRMLYMRPVCWAACRNHHTRHKAPRMRHRRMAQQLRANRLPEFPQRKKKFGTQPRCRQQIALWVPKTTLDALIIEALQTPHPAVAFPDLAGGAGGAATTRRKRWTQPCEPTDITLAQALTEVLLQWKPPEHNTGRSKPAKRPKPQALTAESTSAVAPPQYTPLATQLWNLLNTAETQAMTDQQLVQKLLPILSSYTPAHQTQNPGSHDYTSSRAPTPPTHRNNRWHKAPTNTAPQYITHLVPNEWSRPPRLGNYHDILQAARTGNTIPEANITEIWSREDAEAIRSTWRAHDLKHPITMLLCGPAKKLEGVTHTRIRVSRGRRQTIEDVALLALGTPQSQPWLSQKPIEVQDSTLKPIQRHTLRIAAPTEFRQYFHDHHDRPRNIVADMAQWEPDIRTSALTGGQWHENWTQNSPTVTGFVRLPCDDAQKLLPHSGTRGIFLNIQEPNSQPKHILWIQRQSEEPPDQYLARCLQQAKGRKTGLFFRKGKTPHNLGLLATGDEAKQGRPRSYLIRGLPKNWEAEELAQFLIKQKWQDPERFTKSRFKHEWKFQGISPDSSTDAFHYCLNNTDAISCILAPRKPPANHQAWPLRNTWQGPQKPSPAARPPQVKPQSSQPTEANSHQNKDDTTNSTDTRERSPRRGAHKDSSPMPPDRLPSNPEEALKQGWVLQDYKGAGDCCYRAIAGARAKAQKDKSLSEDEARRAGAELRSLAVAHTRKHKDRLKQWFAPDQKETAHQRSNLPPATTIDEWCDNMEHMATWADGLAIHSLAERAGLTIIVWKKESNDTWSRYTFAPKFTDDIAAARRGEPPICIVLENNHYTALHPPKPTTIPKPWLFKTINQRHCVVIDLTGAGRSIASRTPSSLHTIRTQEPAIHRRAPSLHDYFMHTDPAHTTAALPPDHRSLPSSPSSERRPPVGGTTASPGRDLVVRDRATLPSQAASLQTASPPPGSAHTTAALPPDHRSLPSSSSSERRPPAGATTASPGRDLVIRDRATLPSQAASLQIASPHQQPFGQGSVPLFNSEQQTEEGGEYNSERTEGGEHNSERTEEEGERCHAGSVPHPTPGSVPLQTPHPSSPPISNHPLNPQDKIVLTSTTLQQLQQQELPVPSGKKEFPPPKIRKRDAARPQVEGWYNWDCPVCHENIQIRGHNNGSYYKNKHLRTVHQTSLSKFPTPRSNTTLRCQLRAKQMQTLVQPKDQHDLIHIHTIGLHSCVPKSTTWICKTCLAKGSTAKMHQFQCDPDHPSANRAKWWAKLSPDQKNLLASKLDMQPDALSNWEQKLNHKLNQKRKRFPSVGSAKDKAHRIKYRQELAERRKGWREQHAITTNARAASGAVNGTSVFIPTIPPRLNKRVRIVTSSGQPATPCTEPMPEQGIHPPANPAPITSSRPSTTTTNPTMTPSPLPTSRSTVQRARSRVVTAKAMGRGALRRTTTSRTTSKKMARRTRSKIDLTEQGIEPNPGPHGHRPRPRPPANGLRIWQCNVRSFHKQSSILLEALTLGIHVVLLQETRLSDITAQQIAAHNRHWQFFHQASSRVPGPHDTPDGGVAIAVRKGLPAVRAKGHHTPDGEWLRVAMQGLHVLSVYRRPGLSQPKQHQWNDAMFDHLATLGAATWFAGGDWNTEPEDDPLHLWAGSLQAAIYYPTETDIDATEHSLESQQYHLPQSLPTRWNGDRCIDWSIQRNQQAQPHLSHRKFADHKLLEYTLQIQPTSTPTRRFEPRPRYDRPAHLTDQAWQNLVTKYWELNPAPHPDTLQDGQLDTHWQTLQHCLSHAFQRAHQEAFHNRQDAPHQPRNHLKGTIPNTCYHIRHHRADPMDMHNVHLTQLRRLWRRHSEYWGHHHQRSQPGTRALVRHLHSNSKAVRCPYNPFRYSDIPNLRDWLTSQISAAETTIQQTRLRQWRQKLRNNHQKVWHWLARTVLLQPADLMTES